jgi:NADPH-dependent 2,4-dienoyl-CoA reductase/sulfur reductase-like enzyme
MGKNVVIIGGGAGGASAAAEARRGDPSLSIIMLEEDEQVSFTACPMPYFISDAIKDPKRLIARTPEKFIETGVDVRIKTRVEGIDRRQASVILAGGGKIPYDVLVFGTGTTVQMPGIPGEEREGVFVLREYEDSIRIKKWIKDVNCRKAIVIGAGFIALEMSESFRELGIETNLYHRGDLPASRWDAEFSQTVLDEITRHGVKFFPQTQLKSIEEGREHRLRLVTNHGEDDADLILVAIGIKPNVKLASQIDVPLGKTGAIGVNFSQKTALEGIYAVGDCCESFHRVSGRWVNVPLGDIANKQGRVAGNNIGGGSLIFPGIVGAQSFKVFDLEVASTGINEKEAVKAGFHPVSASVSGNAIAPSMPGNKKLTLKLVADKTTGRLLGAQGVGERGVVSRINILSTALWGNMTLDDAGYLDLAYAPPFSGAWDAIHICAQALRRKL